MRPPVRFVPPWTSSPGAGLGIEAGTVPVGTVHVCAPRPLTRALIDGHGSPVSRPECSTGVVPGRSRRPVALVAAGRRRVGPAGRLVGRAGAGPRAPRFTNPRGATGREGLQGALFRPCHHPHWYSTLSGALARPYYYSGLYPRQLSACPPDEGPAGSGSHPCSPGEPSSGGATRPPLDRSPGEPLAGPGRGFARQENPSRFSADGWIARRTWQGLVARLAPSTSGPVFRWPLAPSRLVFHADADPSTPVRLPGLVFADNRSGSAAVVLLAKPT